MSYHKAFHKILIIIILTISSHAFTQNNHGAFKTGEWFKYKLRYGIINAGYATLEVQDTIYNSQPNYFIKGKGWTTGMVKFFFKVEDVYQTIVDKNTLHPNYFIRRVNEGGYTKKKDIIFNHITLQARVENYKHKTSKTYTIPEGIQDMISSMYYLRNTDLSSLKLNEEAEVNLFYDQKINKFKVRFLGKEIIRTKFGKIKAIMLKPIVESGRVFKGKNSVTVWVSDDENKIPLKIKADLVVGSLKAELESFKGLANAFPVIFN